MFPPSLSRSFVRSFPLSFNRFPSLSCSSFNERKSLSSSFNPSFFSSSSSSSATFSVDTSEVNKFSSLSSLWWRLDGPLGQLHRMQEARVKFIRESFIRHRASNSFSTRDSHANLPFHGYTLLDVGCGGGILAESLTRLGGKVKGIDAAHKNILIAQQHQSQDEEELKQLDYEHITAEQLIERGELFDFVCCLEVVEHVQNQKKFVEILCNLVKPGGSVVLSTLNRTNLSYFGAILMAERVLGFAPPGTHQWEKFVTPQELKSFVQESKLVQTRKFNQEEQEEENRPNLGFQVDCINGMIYNPFSKSWALSDNNVEINYILSAKRQF
jgi:ubiquinone biosynthesis O-methyltransferase